MKLKDRSSRSSRKDLIQLEGGLHVALARKGRTLLGCTSPSLWFEATSLPNPTALIGIITSQSPQCKTLNTLGWQTQGKRYTYGTTHSIRFPNAPIYPSPPQILYQSIQQMHPTTKNYTERSNLTERTMTIKTLLTARIRWQ